MAGNAYQFLHDNLLPEHLYCYIARLLSHYSELIVGTPAVHPGMESVVPETPHDCSTTCQKVVYVYIYNMQISVHIVSDSCMRLLDDGILFSLTPLS